MRFLIKILNSYRYYYFGYELTCMFFLKLWKVIFSDLLILDRDLVNNFVIIFRVGGWCGRFIFSWFCLLRFSFIIFGKLMSIFFLVLLISWLVSSGYFCVFVKIIFLSTFLFFILFFKKNI